MSSSNCNSSSHHYLVMALLPSSISWYIPTSTAHTGENPGDWAAGGARNEPRNDMRRGHDPLWTCISTADFSRALLCCLKMTYDSSTSGPQGMGLLPALLPSPLRSETISIACSCIITSVLMPNELTPCFPLHQPLTVSGSLHLLNHWIYLF